MTSLEQLKNRKIVLFLIVAKIGTVNLEHGLPTAKAALMHLEADISGAKLRGVKVLRVIHGYGSSGKGGKIRNAVRNALPDMKSAGVITGFLHGDDYDEFSVAGRELRDKYPELDKSYKDDRGNPGVTLITI